MEITTRLLLPEVTEALRSNPQELAGLAEELHPADLADLASELEPHLAQVLLTLLPIDVASRMLEACEEDKRAELFGTLALNGMTDAISITDAMAADDRADLYGQLPEDLRAQLLDAIDDEDSRDIRQLLAYPDDTAGALMTTDFVALPASTTAAEAIELVRKNAAEMETIYQAYAVDPHGTLLGAISLRDLVTSPATKSINELLNPNIVAVSDSADQEEAARLMSKYDLLALPVVDRTHRILGIITVDDVLDVVEEEATEDVHKLGAVDPLGTDYMSAPIWQLLKARAPWLIALFLGTLWTETVMEHYHHLARAELAILFLFVPVIISSGGNAGSQSATLIIRSMTLKQLAPRDSLTILRREALVGVLLGAAVGWFGVLRVCATDNTRSLALAGAIGVSLLAVITFGALMGAGVPMLLKRLRFDPAVASTPFIASICDVAGLMIYFEIGGRFLA